MQGYRAAEAAPFELRALIAHALLLVHPFISYFDPLRRSNFHASKGGHRVTAGNASLAVFDTLLDRRVPFGWVNDARTRHLPNAANRASLAEHQKDRAADYRRWVAGVATVASSARWCAASSRRSSGSTPRPFPHCTCSTVAEAELFLRERLRLPPEPLTVAGKLEL